MRRLYVVCWLVWVANVSSAMAAGEELPGIRDVTVEEARQVMVDQPDIVVLDLRTGWEFRRGHLPSALHLNYYKRMFKKHIGALDKSRTYLIYCKSGHRSGATLSIMAEAGFKNILHMKGGIDAWKASGLPLFVDQKPGK